MKNNKLPIKDRAQSLVKQIERLNVRLEKLQDECQHPNKKTAAFNPVFWCEDCGLVKKLEKK